MQEQSNQPTLNLSQRAFLIAQSLRFTSKSLFYLYILLVFYLALGTYSAYVDEDIELAKVGLPFTIIVFSPFLIWHFIRARRSYKRLEEWKDEYVEQAYVIIFNTTVPKGNTTGERVLNLAKAVFPELTPAYIDSYADFTDRIRFYLKRKILKSEQDVRSVTINYRGKSYFIDLALKTPEGHFIVKDFGDKLVTVQDINELGDIVSSKFKNKYQRTDIFRLICVAKKYDQPFLQIDELQRIMTREIKLEFDIDLLVQEKIGYSVLWVS